MNTKRRWRNGPAGPLHHLRLASQRKRFVSETVAKITKTMKTIMVAPIINAICQESRFASATAVKRTNVRNTTIVELRRNKVGMTALLESSSCKESNV